MEKKEVLFQAELTDLSIEEKIDVNGGAYNIWYAIGYVMGVTYAIHNEHAETAPWVAFGSK